MKDRFTGEDRDFYKGCKTSKEAVQEKLKDVYPKVDWDKGYVFVSNETKSSTFVPTIDPKFSKKYDEVIILDPTFDRYGDPLDGLVAFVCLPKKK